MLLAEASACRLRPNSNRFRPFGDDRLQPLQLGGILVDARVIELPQRLENLVELARVDAFRRQVATQRLRLADPLARFAAQLPDVLRRQLPVAAPFPAAVPAAPVVNTPGAAQGAVGVGVTTSAGLLLPIRAA